MNVILDALMISLVLPMSLEMFAGTGRCLQTLAGVGRHWPALADTGRRWQTLAGVGRHWPAFADTGRCLQTQVHPHADVHAASM